MVHCNIVKNDYQQDSVVLLAFFPNRSFADLLEISSTHFIFLNIFNSELPYIEAWLAGPYF